MIVNAERALRNIQRMKDLKVTPDEAQWLLGTMAGTVLMSSALTLLEGHREQNIPVEALADFETMAEAAR